MLLVLLIQLSFSFVWAQIDANDAGKRQIIQIMQNQEKAWNQGNIEAFMKDYWQSEELKFVSKDGITKGWQATLDRYKTGYPDRAAMGTLKFDIIETEIVSSTTAFVIGKYTVTRQNDTLSGHFTLLWKKIGGRWVIVTDHSS